MSNVTIRIPTPLRSYTGGADEVHVQAVGEALHALGAAHDGATPPAIADRRPGTVQRKILNLVCGE